MRDIRSIDPLSAALRDTVVHVRVAAAEALGRIGDPRAFGPLQAALQDPYANVRQAAERALAELPTQDDGSASAPLPEGDDPQPGETAAG
jgi:HEAT repeat protein